MTQAYPGILGNNITSGVRKTPRDTIDNVITSTPYFASFVIPDFSTYKASPGIVSIVSPEWDTVYIEGGGFMDSAEPTLSIFDVSGGPVNVPSNYGFYCDKTHYLRPESPTSLLRFPEKNTQDFLEQYPFPQLKVESAANWSKKSASSTIKFDAFETQQMYDYFDTETAATSSGPVSQGCLAPIVGDFWRANFDPVREEFYKSFTTSAISNQRPANRFQNVHALFIWFDNPITFADDITEQDVRDGFSWLSSDTIPVAKEHYAFDILPAFPRCLRLSVNAPMVPSIASPLTKTLEFRFEAGLFKNSLGATNAQFDTTVTWRRPVIAYDRSAHSWNRKGTAPVGNNDGFPIRPKLFGNDSVWSANGAKIRANSEDIPNLTGWLPIKKYYGSRTPLQGNSSLGMRRNHMFFGKTTGISSTAITYKEGFDGLDVTDTYDAFGIYSPDLQLRRYVGRIEQMYNYTKRAWVNLNFEMITQDPLGALFLKPSVTVQSSYTVLRPTSSNIYFLSDDVSFIQPDDLLFTIGAAAPDIDEGDTVLIVPSVTDNGWRNNNGYRIRSQDGEEYSEFHSIFTDNISASRIDYRAATPQLFWFQAYTGAPDYLAYSGITWDQSSFGVGGSFVDGAGELGVRVMPHGFTNGVGEITIEQRVFTLYDASEIEVELNLLTSDLPIYNHGFDGEFGVTTAAWKKGTGWTDHFFQPYHYLVNQQYAGMSPADYYDNSTTYFVNDRVNFPTTVVSGIYDITTERIYECYDDDGGTGITGIDPTDTSKWFDTFEGHHIVYITAMFNELQILFPGEIKAISPAFTVSPTIASRWSEADSFGPGTIAMNMFIGRDGPHEIDGTGEDDEHSWGYVHEAETFAGKLSGAP
jgi:hypothetical protein